MLSSGSNPMSWFLSSGIFVYGRRVTTAAAGSGAASGGRSALGIKTRRFFQTIPEAMLQEAERVGLPLLELPFFYSFSDISRVVFQRLFLQSSYRVRSEQRLLMALSQLPYFLGPASPICSNALSSNTARLSFCSAAPALVWTPLIQAVPSCGVWSGFIPLPCPPPVKPSPSPAQAGSTCFSV